MVSSAHCNSYYCQTTSQFHKLFSLKVVTLPQFRGIPQFRGSNLSNSEEKAVKSTCLGSGVGVRVGVCPVCGFLGCPLLLAVEAARFDCFACFAISAGSRATAAGADAAGPAQCTNAFSKPPHPLYLAPQLAESGVKTEHRAHG